MIEGKDDYDVMLPHLIKVDDALKTYLPKNGRKLRPWCGGEFAFVLYFLFIVCSGDQIFMSMNLGLCGRFGRIGKNCIYCECDSCDLLKLIVSQPRTLDRIYHMSHLFPPSNQIPFDCPGCGAHFNSQVDVDNDPQPASEREYEDVHASSGWKRRPLLNVEPSDHIICTLHLVLSLSKMIFKSRILPMLLTENIAQSCNAYLKSIGICIPTQNKVAGDTAKTCANRISFTGKEANLLLMHWDSLVDLCCIGAPSQSASADWGVATSVTYHFISNLIFFLGNTSVISLLNL